MENILSDKEEQELKKKNLIMIDEWVKNFCKDGFYCTIDHVFRKNDRDYKVSISKNGIGVSTYGKYASWDHADDSNSSLFYQISGTELVYHWQDIKARILAKREEKSKHDELMKNFAV